MARNRHGFRHAGAKGDNADGLRGSLWLLARSLSLCALRSASLSQLDIIEPEPVRSTFAATTSPIAMFRLALRAAPRVAVRPAAAPLAARAYSAAALTKEDITKRVMEVMRSFEKVDQGKVRPAP